MQTQLLSVSSATKKLSTIPLLLHILRTEGISSLYKGVGPPLISLSIVNTLSFTSYSYFRQNHFHGKDGWDINNGFSGMIGAPIFGIVTTPENFVKTQMQIDNVQSRQREKTSKSKSQSDTQNSGKRQIQMQQRSTGRFNSSLHCAHSLVSSHGLPVLYTGHAINTVREAFFVGAYFFFYEGYKGEFYRLIQRLENITSFRSDDSQCDSVATSLAIPLAGGCAGATAWAFTFPLDCVRAGVQSKVHNLGALDTLKNLLKTKGISGLYSGVGPSIARAFLVSGTRFSAYEGALWLCRRSGLTSQ
jgi:solute carrier family 25 carnitine/acylcarnitine transporter 20/29